MWSAQVMRDHPHLVEGLHREFIEAGARAVIVNAYSASPERLERDGVGGLFVALQEQAIDLARAACEDAPHPVAVLGCLSPHGGSYHPEDQPDEATMRAAYDRVCAVQGPRVDVMLAETMGSVAETRAAARAMAATRRPFWVALTVDDTDGTKLRSGEAVQDGAQAAREAGATAILLNCSRPEAISAGLPLIAGATPIGAYANGFVHASELALGGTTDAMAVRTDLGPEEYADHAMGWVAAGATIVGGCCEVGPGHIDVLRDRLLAAGHELAEVG